MTKQRNTFTRIAGSTYRCETCGRGTRNTGVQGLGCKLCPQCFDLAGFENEISDGYADDDGLRRAAILRLTAEVAAKGGTLENWSDLLATTEN